MADTDTAPLRWGILSTAKIAAGHLVPAMHSHDGHVAQAVGSRDLARATTWAEANGLATAHGSYEALLADPDVDAIYNPLPNHLHVDWSIAALEAGKHVLCEKPLGLDAADAQRLVDAADAHPALVAMEAFMYRFHPQWISARDLVRSGAIGTVKTIQTFFSYFNDDPDNIRNQADIGGGALMDIGCYPISQARMVLDAEPTRVTGSMELDPRFGTDRVTSAMLDFGAGTTAMFTVSTQLEPFQRARIFGTDGQIEIMIPVNSPKDVPTELTISSSTGGETRSVGPVDQYGEQLDAFAAAVRTGSPAPVPLTDGVANMRVIDAIVEASKTGAWVDV
ncbi:MAG: Gfo/Idh/MocA family oxidoreductase [Actinomycetota bacterium]